MGRKIQRKAGTGDDVICASGRGMDCQFTHKTRVVKLNNSLKMKAAEK